MILFVFQCSKLGIVSVSKYDLIKILTHFLVYIANICIPNCWLLFIFFNQKITCHELLSILNMSDSYQFTLVGTLFNTVTHTQETTDLLLANWSGRNILYMKLKETEHSGSLFTVLQVQFNFLIMSFAKTLASKNLIALPLSLRLSHGNLHSRKRQVWGKLKCFSG